MFHMDSFEVKKDNSPYDPKAKCLNFGFSTELELLNAIQSLWPKVDPDIIVGHELFSGILDVYLGRL